jgi:hypothetical protein
MKGLTYSMKNFKFLLLLMALTLLFTACAANTPAPAASADPSSAPVETAQTAAPEATPAVTPVQEATAAPDATPAAGAAEMAQKVKDFILNGQNDLPEAGKLHWTETFLNLVDMDREYSAYLASGGKADDVEGFAKYISMRRSRIIIIRCMSLSTARMCPMSLSTQERAGITDNNSLS